VLRYDFAEESRTCQAELISKCDKLNFLHKNLVMIELRVSELDEVDEVGDIGD
jgi:hypothetical protein